MADVRTLQERMLDEHAEREAAVETSVHRIAETLGVTPDVARQPAMAALAWFVARFNEENAELRRRVSELERQVGIMEL